MSTNPTLAGGLIAAAYLCGSLPVGVWAGRGAGVDVRRHGSGNVGATNVARTAGKRAALLTLGGDVAKGFLPVLVARGLSMPAWVTASVGLAAILGHVFSIWLRFSGGKGVATACGAFLGMAPLAMAVAIVVFAVIAVTTRYVSLASVVGAAALPIASAVIGYTAPIRTAACCAAVLIVFRHKDNLRRLWAGVEPRFRVAG